jgi:succinoglycan biosynthesis transport protein ExoP
VPQSDLPAVEYLQILKRRKWIILQCLLLAPLAALLLSLRQAAEYQASAGVLLDLDRANSLSHSSSAAPAEDPARVVENQARLASSLPVAERVVRASRPAFANARALLDHSAVSTSEGFDLLTISVRHSSRRSAVAVANAYANEYVRYLEATAATQNRAALASVQGRLTELRRQGITRGALYRSLRTTEQQLEVFGAVDRPNASIIPVANGATKVRPRPARSIALGLGIGLLLGLAAAFLWEALDSRIRAEDELAEILGLPLLARIREQPRSRTPQVAMLTAPNSAQAESYRILRVALDSLNHDVGARTLMVTSGIDGEGKSTTAANLAAAYARSGLRAILVDLDLRFPSVDRLFGLEGRAGVTDVALGHVPLDAALVDVPVLPGASSNGDRSYRGSLHVLPAGPVSPELREMVLVHSSAELLAELTALADVVLIDAPPIVPVVDAQALASHVDRLVVVVRWSFARRRALKELRRTLDVSGTPPVGFVLVAGSDTGEGYDRFERPRESAPEPRTLAGVGRR